LKTLGFHIIKDFLKMPEKEKKKKIQNEKTFMVGFCDCLQKCPFYNVKFCQKNFLKMKNN